MIKPTVGRVVWFYGAPSHPDFHNLSPAHPGREPLAAIVTHVWNDKMVNLVVFNMDGLSFGQQSVRLVQDGESHDGEARWCEWMPYQKGQAAKTEALEKQLHPPGAPHISTKSTELDSH